MLRFFPLRFSTHHHNPSIASSASSVVANNSTLSHLSLGQKKTRFLNIISQLDSLHMVLLRREGSPAELKSQAKFLLGDNELTKIIMYEPEVVPTNNVAAFATQVAALSSLRDPPHPQFFAKLGTIFEHHLQIAQKDIQDSEDLFGTHHQNHFPQKDSPLASLQKRRQEQLGLSEEEKRHSSLLSSLRQKHPNDYSSGQDVIFDSQHRRHGSSAPNSRSIGETGLTDNLQPAGKLSTSSAETTPVQGNQPQQRPLQLRNKPSSSSSSDSGRNIQEDDAMQAANHELYDKSYTQHYDYYNSAVANGEQNTYVNESSHHHQQHQQQFEQLQEDNSHLFSTSYPRLVSAVMECIVTLCGDSRSTKLIPRELSQCLETAQRLSLLLLNRESHVAVSLTNNSIGKESSSHQGRNNRVAVMLGRTTTATSSSSVFSGVECSPRHILAFMRCADICLGGPNSFHFANRGVPPQVMLPIKSKHDMERKAQKYSILRELLREVERRLPLLTRIDAHVCIRQFAVIGLFNETIVDACLERITMGLAITPHQQCVDVILHLGVLGHRHVACREIVDTINTKHIGPLGMRKLLRGMAMLQIPWKHELQIKEIHDHVWMWAMRPLSKPETTVAWHIDVAHALCVLGATHHQFLLRTCRLVRNEILLNKNRGKDKLELTSLQIAQLLWTIGKVDRRKVPSDFDRDWVKNVNRVKNALIAKATELASKMVSVEQGDLSLVDHHDHPTEYHQHLHNSPSKVSILRDMSKNNNNYGNNSENEGPSALPLLLQGLEACGVHAGDVMAKTSVKT